MSKKSEKLASLAASRARLSLAARLLRESVNHSIAEHIPREEIQEVAAKILEWDKIAFKSFNVSPHVDRKAAECADLAIQFAELGVAELALRCSRPGGKFGPTEELYLMIEKVEEWKQQAFQLLQAKCDKK